MDCPAALQPSLRPTTDNAMLSRATRLLPKSIVSTLKLPKTTFPPRGASPVDQALYLKKCTDDLYAWQRQNRSDHTAFVLHDGPPYANGDLHIGHALNKILKDITNRCQLLKGRRVDYVPGWDCHGLPIELRALELWRQSQPESASHETPPATVVREKARALATETVEKQKKQFKEWGIMADWDNAWKTMDKAFEIQQLEVFQKMVKKGLIYRRHKPVYWSPSTRTALAEAELEYRDDHVSRAAFVKYPLHVPSIHKGLIKRLGGNPTDISVVIWTTLPWTLPANRAIGFCPSIDYVVARSRRHGRLLLAHSRIQEVEEKCEETLTEMVVFKGSDLYSVCYEDSLWSNQPHIRLLLEADHVTGESGSGLAHLAPGHGSDDYRVCLSRKIQPYSPVDDRGCFTTDACPKDPTLLASKSVFTDGNLAVLQNLESTGALLAVHDYVHKYPYDWRSKAPIILRATRQWFANVADIQNAALESLEDVKFTPASGKSRLESFVCNRNEWCISRQRAWGVPIPALYHSKTHEPLLTEGSVDHIISIIAERGMDAWWTDDELDPTWTPPSLRQTSGETVYYRGKDTIDVWFDSGTSWTQMQPDDDRKPVVADVYLEGSDQHRGWFQSSLLTSTACQDGATLEDGKTLAPFKHLVTHGFTLDKAGTKMSKSFGNVISPQQIMDGSLLPILTKKGKDGAQRKIQDSMGIDALRLWAASCDYTKDVVVSPEALKKINIVLAKYRTTFKQLIGLLNYHDPSTASPRLEHLSTNHKIALTHLSSMEETVAAHFERMEYHKAINALNRYVTSDLSAFYFESVKDAAYCGTSVQRAAVQATAYEILGVLQDVLAPITPLLIQEVQHHLPEALRSTPHVSLTSRQIQPRPAEGVSSRQGDLANVELDLPALMDLLKAVQSLQEQARSDKKMGPALQSYIAIVPRDMTGSSKIRKLMLEYADDLDDIFCASAVQLMSPAFTPSSEVEWHYVQEIETVDEKVLVYVFAPQQQKCVRCWRYKAPLNVEEALCERCVDVLQNLKKDRPELFVEGAMDTGGTSAAVVGQR